ncbi:glycerol-3-phosphate acyltransferase [Chloroflexota bacterium]
MWDWASITLVIGSYFLGGIPLQYFLGRLKGVDLGNEYDMHISLFRKVGPVVGIIGVVVDIAKGIIPVVVANLMAWNTTVAALAGLSVLIGQMWPVYNKFNGEKGNTTGIGVAVALAPRACAVMIIFIAAGAFIRTIPRLLSKNQSTSEKLRFGGPASNSLPIGMVIGFAMFPIASTSWFGPWFAHPLSTTLVGVAMFVLVMLRRATAGVRKDFATGGSKLKIVLNRLLIDRGFWDIKQEQ